MGTIVPCSLEAKIKINGNLFETANRELETSMKQYFFLLQKLRIFQITLIYLIEGHEYKLTLITPAEDIRK